MVERKKTNNIRTGKLFTIHPGLKNEAVWVINPDVVFRNRLGFSITSLNHGVLKDISQSFSITSLWPKSNQTESWKENQTFEKLEEENKIVKIGHLSAPGVITYSKEGADWLDRMARKYKF
jgi:hypothetical protein